MSIDLLANYDSKTANNILAAAALSTAPNPGIGRADDFINRYRNETSKLMADVRAKLGISADDISPKAMTSIERYLSKALNESVLSEADTPTLLAKAGQAGILSPTLYEVEQPKTFTDVFYKLGATKKLVRVTVNEPNDYQHLLTDQALETDPDRDSLSLFLKLVPARRKAETHWSMVQSVRQGLKQVAQSAWRIFPTDVNLETAAAPLEVLEAFADEYGLPIKVGDQTGKFIEATSHPQGQILPVTPTSGKEVFWSFSQRFQTLNPLFSEVGIAYCIDIAKYRGALRKRGFPV
jgi:hypothetical protein